MANKTATSSPALRAFDSSLPGFNKMMGVGPSSANALSAFPSRNQSRLNNKKGNPALSQALDTARGVGKTVGKTALGVGKSLLASPIRVGASLAEAPRVYSGGQPFKPFNVPALGEVKTYARDAADRINAGDGSKLTTAATILGVGGQAMLDTAALGGLAQGAYNQVLNPKGNTTALSNTIRKVSPKAGAKWDQLTYRMYKGAPQGWQMRLSDKFNLPFWKINPNL